MNEDDQIKKLLKGALPQVNAESGPSRDLWPAILRRLDEKPVTLVRAGFNWAWFDGALAAGLMLLVASFPAAIPLLLYYL
ncbi:MAG: hypothetical protein ABR905_22080 [Terracidiphilus sp.]|jgi:hypothetical protein